MTVRMSRWTAAAVGAAFASVAFAAAAADRCGGPSHATCGLGQYCHVGAATCRTPDATGRCKAKPEVCAEIYVPVCGCDGKTYPNACHAAAAGVSVLQAGQCKPTASPAPRS